MRSDEFSSSRRWLCGVIACCSVFIVACGDPASDTTDASGSAVTSPPTTTIVGPQPSLRYGTVAPVIPVTTGAPPPSLRPATVPPVVGDSDGSDAATFVCDTIRVLRADFADIEDDLTSQSWIVGFISALGNVPNENAYRQVVTGEADTAAAELCPDDWAEYLSRAEISTLQGIDVYGL